AASASASTKGWQFRIAVAQAPTAATNCLIFANEEATPGLDEAAAATVGTSRTLDQKALAALRPRRIKVVVAAAGDTEETLARRMRGVDRPRELFRVLNGLAPGAAIAPGAKLKIVSE